MSQPHRCHYCHQYKKLTRDHIVPKTYGGLGQGWNIIGACADCNVAKGMTWPSCQCDICKYAKAMHIAIWGAQATDVLWEPKEWRRGPSARNPRVRMQKAIENRMTRYGFSDFYL